MTEDTLGNTPPPPDRKVELLEADIELGRYKTGAQYIKALKKEGWTLTPEAEALILSDEFTCSERRQIIRVVMPTVRELGFTPLSWNDGDLPTLKQIEDRAKKLGYELCPPEVALALLFSKKMTHNVSTHRVLHVATGPLFSVTAPHMQLFMIFPSEQSRDDARFVSVQTANAWESDFWEGNGVQSRVWGRDKRFVFVKPKR
jgi:hypothetical protein